MQGCACVSLFSLRLGRLAKPMLIRRLFVPVSLPGWKGSLALGADGVDFTIPPWKCARLQVNIGHVHGLSRIQPVLPYDLDLF